MQNKTDFYFHLKAQNYVNETASYYQKNIQHYKNWLTKNKLEIENTTYQTLLNYVGFLQESKSNIIINKHLKSLELYYDFKELSNIVSNVRLKTSKANTRLYLKEKELKCIYDDFKTTNTNYYQYSDKILLSLTIYQALEKQEIYNLKLSDVNLEKGTIYIASGKHLKNSRTLKLEAHQIIPLHTYITNHREENEELEQLFLPQCKAKNRLSKQLTQLHKILLFQLKEEELIYQSLKQLRQSRIVIWIKQYGLRQAQYLSGHKGITSIERYKGQDIEDLSKQIEKLHPLG
jgi:integrase/recombinase XerD